MKVWLLSDTHGKHGMVYVPLDVDLMIFAGDAGTTSETHENNSVVLDFIEWMDSLEHIPNKVWIAGNHDTSIGRKVLRPKELPGYNKNWIYLEHEAVTLNIDGREIKIFGSPYTPSFGYNWAFNVKRNKIDAYWQDIPEGLDFLITHGPPRGILDYTESGVEFREYNEVGNVACYACGDAALKRHIEEKKPKYHVFGHIHSERNCSNAGIFKPSNSRTTFINAAVLDLRYQLNNDGVILEI